MFLVHHTKFVQVLKHIWGQSHKSPRKQKLMQKYWNIKSKDMCGIMLKMGKQHRARKDIHKIKKLVVDIKSKYPSL